MLGYFVCLFVCLIVFVVVVVVYIEICLLLFTRFPRTVSRQGHCHISPWLSEFSGVVQTCYTVSSPAIFLDVSLIIPEDSFNPLFKAVHL